MDSKNQQTQTAKSPKQTPQESPVPQDEVAELRAKLAAAEEEKEAALLLAREAQAALKAVPDKSELAERETAAALRQQKKYVLTINSTETETAPVPVSFNGVAHLITRDTEVLVPKGVINILNLSKVGNPVQEQRGQHVVTRFQSTKRFSYSYREATAEDESKLAGK